MPRDKNNPQLEDGYIRIANDLMVAILAGGFSQRELLVLFSIIRKTYGYNKKTDDMVASQIEELCKIARPHVTKTLNDLALRNVISKSPGRFGHIIGIQKNHRKWIGKEIAKGPMTSTDSVQGCTDSVQGTPEDESTGNSESENIGNGLKGAPTLVLASTESVHPSTKSVHVPNQYSTSTESVQVDSTESVHTKDNLPKDNKQKTSLSGKPDAVALLDYLNLKANRNYRPVKANVDLILGRLSESSVDECRAVIDLKVKQWLSDSKMNEFLRPKTIFNATNFANYVGELPNTRKQPELLPEGDPDAWRKGLFAGVK